MSFKDEFAATPPGPARERLVYQAVISQGKPEVFPVSIQAPGGIQITFYITKDFLKIDGIYLPMTGTTAQAIADYFHMHIPSNKISDLVWENANVKLKASPLSGSGYRGIDGKWFSPKEVVNSRIGASDASLAFSQKINEQLSNHKQDQLVDGHMKWIVSKPRTNSLGLHGWRDQSGKSIQRGWGTIHSEHDHAEYASGLRLIDDKIDITYPGGKTETLTMAQFLKTPFRDQLFDEHQDLRNGQLARYDLKKDQANLPKTNDEISKSPVSTDNITTPKYYSYIPGLPPEGYKAPNFKRAPPALENKAKETLNLFLSQKYPLGTMLSANIGGKNYIFRSEKHSNSNYGISLYEQKRTPSLSDEPEVSGNAQILQRLSDYLDKINKMV